jgi:hypothetical protein
MKFQMKLFWLMFCFVSCYCLQLLALFRGPPKTNRGPRGWVGQERTGVRFIFSIFFFVVFLNSPPREKNREKTGFGFFVDSLAKRPDIKTFSTRLFR